MLQFCSLIFLHLPFIIYILNKGERSYSFFPGWIIFFASEERAIDLKVALILITMVTFLLLFVVIYPQTALLLLVRDTELHDVSKCDTWKDNRFISGNTDG
jgi:hypothetical protein